MHRAFSLYEHERRQIELRQKKPTRSSSRRTEVNVSAYQSAEVGRGSFWFYSVRHTDGGQHIGTGECVSRSNVASKAAELAANKLNIPVGRIKITDMEYV